MDEEFLKRLGLSIARGVPQMATGFVDLAALPFTMTGLLDEKDVVGGTEYLTQRGLLPPAQEGLLNETTEMVSSALSPGGAIKGGLLGLGSIIGAKQAGKTFGERVTNFGDVEFDPRFDKRIKEQPRLRDTTTTVEQTANLDAPVLPLTDFEGHPFITSMSDRTAAGGLLTSINDVNLKRPVSLPGGQDFMFTNDFVWSSGNQPVNALMQYGNVAKKATGRDPIFVPYRMAPTGGDFATMTGETMLSYAESALPKSAKKPIDKAIKGIFPDWKGIDSPDSIKQYESMPDRIRKQIKNTLDVEFRDLGGLSIGQARLSVADPKQLAAKEGEIMNIGRIFADQPIIQASGHPSYPRGVPGEGLGRVDRNISIYEMLPDAVKARGIADPTKPSAADLRALQMHPYAGLITSDLLKRLGY